MARRMVILGVHAKEPFWKQEALYFIVGSIESVSDKNSWYHGLLI